VGTDSNAFTQAASRTTLLTNKRQTTMVFSRCESLEGQQPLATVLLRKLLLALKNPKMLYKPKNKVKIDQTCSTDSPMHLSLIA